MAVTSLWRIKGGGLGRVVRYAENEEKTNNPKFSEKPDPPPEQRQWLASVINYAVQSRKTECADESTDVLKCFVTGINCMPETAREEMTATKVKFSKQGGVVAYHGYQSFAPGEATPEIAHEISVKLARQLWGDRHEVVVATHLDKADHLHSHFVLNTVSFVDGRKFYRSEKDYYDMQRASDALCREYGLSVIEEPKRGKSKHYAEWQAERNGKPTYRNMIKTDVDAAIRLSMTESQFFANLRKMGYHIKSGQDITIRPEGKERGLKLKRNFGEGYSIEGIRRRILAQSRPERRIIPPDSPPKKKRLMNSIRKVKRTAGLRALYFYYLYRMGVFPKKREPNPKRIYFLFREDIRFIRNISRETRLLAKYGIDNSEQLSSHKEALNAQIKTLSAQRKQLYVKARRIKDEDKIAAVKSEISALSGKISKLRREAGLCEDIEKRSGDMRGKLRKASEEGLSSKKQNTKEMSK